MKVLIPGSFDPPTFGHLDIIRRCIEIFDEVMIGVVSNPDKQPMFTSSIRVEMLKENILVEKLTNVTVKEFDGLLVEFAKQEKIDFIVKGVRAMTDFDYEFQMAQVNKDLDTLETLFIPGKPEYGYISSSLVKELYRLGGDVSSFIPNTVLERLQNE